MLKRIIFFLTLVVLMFFGYRLINQEGADKLLTDIRGRVMPWEDTGNAGKNPEKSDKKIIITKTDTSIGQKITRKNTEDVNKDKGENITALEKEDEKNNNGTKVVIANLSDSKVNNDESVGNKGGINTNDTDNNTKGTNNFLSGNNNKQVSKKQVVIVDYHDEEILDRFANNVR